jgi:hypothetical protein
MRYLNVVVKNKKKVCDWIEHPIMDENKNKKVCDWIEHPIMNENKTKNSL